MAGGPSSLISAYSAACEPSATTRAVVRECRVAWPRRNPGRRRQRQLPARQRTGRRPASSRAAASGARSAPPSVRLRPSAGRSRSTTEARTWIRPPGQSEPATAWAKLRSPSATARSSEPHGKVMRTSSTRPSSNASAAAASPTRNSALGRPPLRVGPAARRDASRRLLASVSTPMARTLASLRAARTTAEPSPVPRSTIVRAYAAIS